MAVAVATLCLRPQASRFVPQCRWYFPGALRDFPHSLKRTLAASATAAAAAVAIAAARTHQIPHTMHAPPAMVRPCFIADVRLQGECFVMRREPLSAKEGIDGCKQSDRQGGGGGCQPYGAWKSRFLSINMAGRRILGPGSEMPLWHRLLLIDGVCDGSRVIYHARVLWRKTNAITSRCAITVLPGWSVRLAVCGTRRAEYAKPF